MPDPVRFVAGRIGDEQRLVEQATRLLLDALPERLKFQYVALCLGVAVRDLEQAYAHQGLHPRHHLRRARLERLHADLAAARFDTVSAAMLRWGFPASSEDVGRDYLKRYNCRPQATLEGAIGRAKVK